MYLLFIWRGTNYFYAGKSISKAIGRGGPYNQAFFGPWNDNEPVECHCDQKSRDFQGPPFPMARVIDLPQSKSLSAI